MPVAVVTGGASGPARAAGAARTLLSDESPDRA